MTSDKSEINLTKRFSGSMIFKNNGAVVFRDNRYKSRGMKSNTVTNIKRSFAY